MRTRTDLSHRASRTPVSSNASSWTQVLAADAEAATSRILTVQADNTVQVKLGWSAGKGHHTLTLSLARGARISVWARSLQVDIQQSTGQDVLVNVTVADGFEDTGNQLVVDLAADANAVQDIDIPAFAKAVRLELNDPSQLGAAYVQLRNAAGNVASKTLGNAQPFGKISLAGAASLQVLAPTDGRLVFDLCL